MAKNILSGKRAAFLVDNGFCEREFKQAEASLMALGITCRTVSVSGLPLLKGWNENKDSSRSNWGDEYVVHSTLNNALPSDFDMLVMPGGRRSIEKLRISDEVRVFVSSFFHANKPIMAYNQALALLTSYDQVKGYSLAAKDALCDTAKVAGGRCAQPELVVSKNLITLSRYRDVGDKIQNAIISVFTGEPYIEKVTGANDIPSSHKAA